MRGLVAALPRTVQLVFASGLWHTTRQHDERRSLRLDTRMTPNRAVLPALVPGGRGGSALTTDGSVPENQRGNNRRGEHRFFSTMAAAIVLTALAGFARTYFLRPLLPAPAPPPRELTPLIHLHGLLFTGWVLLLLAQVRLVAAKRIGLHRRLGVAGAAMAALMVGVGTLTAIYGVVRGVTPFGMDPRRFLIVPLFAIGLFSVFVVAGVRTRRDAQSHKRFMLLATIALLPPAIARWVLLLGLGPPVVLAVSTLFLLPLAGWDLKTCRRLHPVTLWGGLLLVVSGPLRLALAQTDGWLVLSDWLVRLVK